MVEEVQVREYVSKLDVHKSVGPRGMPPQVLRELAESLQGHSQSSLIGHGHWEKWRKANATPIFKKGKKEDPGNYRPVSLTSVPGKVIEQ